MKILNLYAGIGGNRKLWGNEHEITVIEYDPKIAEVYKKFFPDDNVIVTDAHQYLLENYMNYDFIWSSPPCPSHSDIRRCGVKKGQYKALYPDMKLYQEIILLQNFAPKDTFWVIENVKPYYEYLIKPNRILQRHPFWCNFEIKDYFEKDKRKGLSNITGSETFYGFNIKDTKIKDKRKSLRNLVNPKLALHILNSAIKKDYDLYEQIKLFK